MKKHLSLFFFLAIVNISNSQNLQIFVKRGSVIISNKIVKAGRVEVIAPGDIVKLNPSSLALILQNKKIIEIGAEKEYKFNDIVGLFNTNKTFSGAFVETLLNQDYSAQKQSLSTSRGINNSNPCDYSPLDSIRVISDSITFSTGGASCELLSDIKLVRVGSNDTAFIPKGTKYPTVKCPPPGKYFWVYKIQNGSIISTYRNIFIVPESSISKSLYINYKNYSESLNIFTKELQEQLIAEYFSVNKIYIK